MKKNNFNEQARYKQALNLNVKIMNIDEFIQNFFSSKNTKSFDEVLDKVNLELQK